MTDHHAEEQEMEAEALAAIFDVHFGSLPNDNVTIYNHYWFIDIYPESASDPDELNKLNHVAIKLLVRIPKSYPDGEDGTEDGCLPVLSIELIKGLVPDPHQTQLLEIARQEAQANQGAPSIFAIVERLREWLVEHNRPGLDDLSMHAQMMMRQQEQEKQRVKQELSAAEAAVAAEQQGMEFESHMTHDQMSAAELEEMAVRKRRAEGTPCNKENFDAWKIKFDAEMQVLKEQEQAKEDAASSKAKKKTAASAAASATASASGVTATAGGATTTTASSSSSTIDRSNRITGFDYFSDKATNLEALEAAAERAEQDENASISGDDDDEEEDDDDDDEGNDMQDYNKELFEDDVDLDDLDFDDDDDDEDEPNI